jgi:hypothetical protein
MDAIEASDEPLVLQILRDSPSELDLPNIKYVSKRGNTRFTHTLLWLATGKSLSGVV